MMAIGNNTHNLNYLKNMQIAFTIQVTTKYHGKGEEEDLKRHFMKESKNGYYILEKMFSISH